MHAKGTDKRGQGGANASIVSTLREEGGETVVDVITDFTITGRLARFGRGGMIEDISKRMMRDFSQCLQATLTSEPAPRGARAAAAPAASAAPGRGRRRRRVGRRRRRGGVRRAGPPPRRAAAAAPPPAAGGQARARHPARALGAVGADRALLRAPRRARREVSEARSWSGAEYDRLSGAHGGDGARGARAPAAGGRRDGHRRRLRLGPRDRGAARPAAARARDRRRRLGLDDRRGARAPGRPRRAARGRPRRRFDLGLQADAILSTATFHWIADHDALFARLRAHLRDGGRLVAQCGGQGNIASVHAAAREVMAGAPYAPQLRGLAGPVELRRARRRPRSACARRASPRRAPGCRSAR